MEISKAGIEELIKHEGEVLEVYKDAVGKLTVGVGHLVLRADKLDFKEKITKERSRELLKKDLAWTERTVNRAIKVPLTQSMYDALCSLCFNIGSGNFQNSKSVTGRINKGEYELGGKGFGKWNKGTIKGKLHVIKGLVNRRKKEIEWFFKDGKTPKKRKSKR